MAPISVALQLYTVRNETAKDFAGTLRRVAAIGYAGVEFAGFGDLTVQQVKELLTELNLQAVGTHTGADTLEKDMARIVDEHYLLGAKYVTISWMPAQPDIESWKAEADRLTAIGDAVKAQGLTLCYHNHAHEFEWVDGKHGLDLLFAYSNPETVMSELDVYWVKKGGEDPVKYIKRYAGRLPLLHCKDMAGDEEGSFTEVGMGTLDWDGIFAAAPEAGVQWYVVEQDICKRPCLESAEISFRNLQARGIA